MIPVNFMKKQYLFIILSFLIFNCKSIPRLTEDQETDFSKTGFLTDHYYQIVIKSAPDRGLKSLLEQRENSSVKNLNILNEKIKNALKSEIKTLYSEKIPEDKIEEKLISDDFKARFSNILNHGNIVYNFYDDKNYNIIVYRIRKKNIRNILGTILDDSKEK